MICSHSTRKQGMTADLGLPVTIIGRFVPLRGTSPGYTAEVGLVANFERPTELNLNRVVLQRRQLIGATGGTDMFPLVIALMSQGRLRGMPMVTAEIDLDDIVSKGYEALTERRDEHAKILVHMPPNRP